MSLRLLGTSLLAVVAMTAACSSTQDDSASNENAATVDGTPGSMVGGHNMNLFGNSSKLYLSHIPLYQNPHGKQVVVEVSVTDGVPANVVDTFNTANFTVAPSAAMSLYDFANGTVPSIKGTIYYGNLESGGRPVFRNVTFKVNKVIFQKTLSNATPVNDKLQYIAVGTPDNAYLVHVIDKAPSFDQVVGVKLPADTKLTAEQLDKGQLVTVNGGVNGIRTRLSANLTIQAEPQLDVASAAGAGGSANANDIPATDLVGSNSDLWAQNGAVVTESPGTNILQPGTNAAVTIVKELACLPGPDFYGACPAVSVTH